MPVKATKSSAPTARRYTSQLLCPGRHTLTGVLGTHGQLFEDWTADYQMYADGRCDPDAIFSAVRLFVDFRDQSVRAQWTA